MAGGGNRGTMFSTRSRYPRPAVLCRSDALGPRASLPLCYNSSAGDTCLSSNAVHSKQGRRLPDAHSGRLPPQQEFGCSDYASICSGIIVCVSAFNISGILRPSPHPPFFFLILQLWFCPWRFERVTETFPLGEWPACSTASQRDYGAAAADQVRDGHGHVSEQTASL